MLLIDTDKENFPSAIRHLPPEDGLDSNCEILMGGLEEEMKLWNEEEITATAHQWTGCDKSPGNAGAHVSGFSQGRMPTEDNGGEKERKDGTAEVEEAQDCIDVSALVSEADAVEREMMEETSSRHHLPETCHDGGNAPCPDCAVPRASHHSGLSGLMEEAWGQELNMWNEELKLKDWNSEDGG
ncbi:hypothetical protein GUITHDRAFT_103713 [Guillardia theta CCMP2712]|uniref:Uncharacterized protein n=2 Tax=Guillardia theta TaxID=55529 RepID=L1JQB7_GUITC|nr:hypothetical protein GUITHDRAFT_103713 [Guillardia theta CCMP2712]EKX50479.1 hypothetical protein GUITHDRAFT_103713 [Guillardia theta CCMP2712]|eukprot:XP_005837459.1 hypothetical protein GUITHDRAFT_103713 [Guillardia theta CCMP2712]